MTDDEMAETIMRELPAAYEIMPPDILCGYISSYSEVNQCQYFRSCMDGHL